MLEKYADTVLRNGEEEVKRVEWIEAHNYQQAENMFNCPARNNGRTIQEILASTRFGNAIEFALYQRLARDFPDVEKNLEEFVVGDPDSYNWDVRQGENFFECKTFKDKWFSYYPRSVSTMRRNIDRLDYVVCATVMQYADAWVVDFKLVAEAGTFFSHERTSSYDNEKMYYDHREAMAAGHAVVKRGI